VAIEERKRLSRGADLSQADRNRLDLSLKITANAGAYGIFGQFDRHVLPSDVTEPVWFYGSDGRRVKIDVSAPEEPGKFAFPPLAACITAGARLMLALLERLITDAGGVYAFCDTDSMAVVSTETCGTVPFPEGTARLPDGKAGYPALSWHRVDQLRDRFTPLNLYDHDAVPGSILRLEKANFEPASGERRQIYCYAISAKRYALCTYDVGGHLALCDDGYSEHGLGLYVNPTNPDEPDRDWLRVVWDGILAEDALGERYAWPDWTNRPAASQLTVSAPALLRPFRRLNINKAYADQIKPFNFLATVHVAPFGHPPGLDPERFHLIAPWTADARLWPKINWINRYSASGESYRITTNGPTGREGVARVKTMGEVIAEYARHLEAKSLDAQGAPCGKETKGLLQRRPVIGTYAYRIGKESNDLENRTVGLVHDLEEVVTEYQNARRDPFRTLVLPVLRSWSARRIAKAVNLDRTSVARIRSGRTPHRVHAAKLLSLAAGIARTALRGWRGECADDDVACCYAYLRQRAARGVRSCRVCRKPLMNLRARYCSAACKHRAFRLRKRGNVARAR
jgi:hypothetical protein